MGIVCVLLLRQLLLTPNTQFMAEIHVQAKRKSSSAWLWILISIIILGTIAFILLWNNNAEVREKITNPTQTSMVAPINVSEGSA